jgi:hypothetical protein
MKTKLVNVTVIPAEAGYKLLWRSMVEDDTKAEEIDATWFSDVMGWRVETYQRADDTIYSFVNAVTLDGCLEVEYAIIRPDGVVEIPEDTTLPDIATYITHVTEYDKRQAALRAEYAAIREAANG